MDADFETSPIQPDPSKAAAHESRAVSDSAALEAAILRQPNIAECAVLTKPSVEGDQRIAYVVPIGTFSRKTLENRLLESAKDLKLADSYVPVTTLPLTERGDLDEQALLRLPVVEEAVAQALEAELLANPRIAHGAVFVEPMPRRPRALHVTELVPAEALGTATAKAPATPAQGSDARDPNADLAAAVPEADASLPPALSHGAPLERGPGGPETLPDALKYAAERVSDKGITYLASDGTTREQSLSELYTEARRICRGLQDRGLARGQYVLLQLGDADDVLPAFWGCLLGGFVPAITPIPPSYEAGTNELERLCHVIELLDGPPLLMRDRLRSTAAPLQARLSIGDEKLIALEALRNAPDGHERVPLDADDVAFLVFTSGSTGAPKIIQLTHRNILTRSQGTNQLCRHEQSDRILNWLPFDHIGSISDWHLRCVDLGCHMVYCAKEYVLGDPLNWLRLIDRFRITHSWAPNFAYALVNEALNRTNDAYDLSTMKALLTAGEAVSSNTVHDFLRRLAPHGLLPTALRPAFGMAELGSGVTYYLPTRENPVRVQHVDRARLEGALRRVADDDPRAIGFTSLGPVIPGAGMRIVDENNVVLPELSIGRLQISGGPVTKGYFRNPDANREVFVGEGWFNTGDRGFIADSELYLTGRDKESLIVNGANYSNSEIEAAVEEVPGVLVSFTAACAVRAVGSPEERLAIFFSPASAGGLELAQLLRKVQNSVTRKTGVKPDYLLPVTPDVIPKTAIGKIQRKQLVKRFESGDFDAPLKEVDVLLENEHTIPDWFLSPGWRPKKPKGRRAPAARRSYLLIADRHGLAEQIRQQLERRGFQAVIGASGDPGAFTDIVLFAGYAPVGNTGNGGGAETQTSSASASAAEYAIGLIDGIRRHAPGATDDRLRYWVIASHSEAISLEDSIDAARVVGPSVVRALAEELTTVECRHVDLPFTADPVELAARADLVVAELDALAADSEVAFREGDRLVPCFERVDFAPVAERKKPISRGGLYLVTGGLGGVGAELARHLLTVWGASLIIIGRTPIATNGGPGGQKRELLGKLEKLGSVRYFALDLSRAAEIERAVQKTESELGKPLSGAFHLASVYHERPAIEESQASFASLLAPKVDGTIALHRLLASRPEAFVACFSSVVSVFGSAGFAAYAAANRFVDAYCHEQRHRYGLSSYSIDWSVWDGLGIAAEGAAAEILSRLGQGEENTLSAADVTQRMIEAERSRGFLRMPAAHGIRSLVAALSLPPGQLLVGVDVVHPNMQGITVGSAEPLLGIRGAFAVRDSHEDSPGEAREPVLPTVRDRFGQVVEAELRRLSAPPLTAEGQLDRDAVLAELRGAARKIIPPSTPLQHQLAEIWKEVLGLESLGINESFFDLGGTSLLSVRLFAEIERRIGVSLQLATLFQAATIEALAELLESKSASRPLDSLSMLAEANGKSSLFLIHDAAGETALYRDLAEHLAPAVRVYGLSPHSRDRFPALHTRIEDMVSHYVDKIRSVEASGPYRIGGVDAGGVLAFEVACRLQALGEQVSLVALLDSTDAALRAGGLGAVRRGLGSLLAKNGKLKSSAQTELNRVLKRGFDHARVRLLHRYSGRGASLPWFLEHIPPEVVYGFAISDHQPSQFRGRLTLYRATRWTLDGERDDTPARERCGDEVLGWSPRASDGVDVVDVAGGHVSMLAPPHVVDLAAKLAAAIHSTQRT